MPDLVRAGAGRLARRAAQGAGPTRELLAFVLAGELYAVELERIREILGPPPITPVPRAAVGVIGVCSVRGLLVTVLDLRRRLRLVEEPPSRRSRILLANAASGETIGLFVDEVRHVIRLAESEIEVAASALGGELSEHVLGVGRPDGAFVVLLDLDAVLGR